MWSVYLATNQDTIKTMMNGESGFRWFGPAVPIESLPITDFGVTEGLVELDWLPNPIGTIPFGLSYDFRRRPSGPDVGLAVPGNAEPGEAVSLDEDDESEDQKQLPSNLTESLPVPGAPLVPQVMSRDRLKEALGRFVDLVPETEESRATALYKMDERPDVVDFFNEFGPLGLPTPQFSQRIPSPIEEAVPVWLYCAAELRIFISMVRTVRLSNFRDVYALQTNGRLFVVVDIGDGHRSVWYDHRAKRRCMIGSGYALPFPESLDTASAWEKDPEGCVVGALQVVLRAWLDELVKWELGFSYPRDDDTNRFTEVNLRPVNLLGALWLTAMEELSPKLLVKTCPGCLQQFNAYDVSEVKLGRQPRSDLTYCSPSCAKRVTRRKKGRRQMERLELAVEGFNGSATALAALNHEIGRSGKPSAIWVRTVGRCPVFIDVVWEGAKRTVLSFTWDKDPAGTWAISGPSASTGGNGCPTDSSNAYLESGKLSLAGS